MPGIVLFQRAYLVKSEINPKFAVCKSSKNLRKLYNEIYFDVYI